MDKIIKDILEEVDFAQSKYNDYHSIHEGYAIIAEEFDELWDEIKTKDVSLTKVYNEAKQVACTTLRFMKLVEKLKSERNIIT